MSDNPRWKDREEARDLIEQAIHESQQKIPFEQVLAMLETAIQLDPGNPEGYFYRGMLYSNYGHYLEAEEDLFKVLEMNEEGLVEPECLIKAHALLGKMHFAYNCNYLEAERHFREVLKIQPDAFEVRSALGVAIYRQGGRNAEAKENFEQALSFAPDDEPTLLNYGNIFYDEGNFRRAAPIFARAAKNTPLPPLGVNVKTSEVWDKYSMCVRDANVAKPIDPDLN